MPIDVQTPFSVGWWMQTLAYALHRRNVGPTWKRTGRRTGRPGLNLLEDYLRGEPPLPDCAAGWQEGFANILRLSRLNLAELSVDPVVERMDPIGFRTSASTDAPVGDLEADKIMTFNDFRLRAAEITLDMLVFGDGYSLAMPTEDPDHPARITAEDPRQCITAHDESNGDYLAGLRVWHSEWEEATFASLYLPDEAGCKVWTARHEGRNSPFLYNTNILRFDPSSWEGIDELSPVLPIPDVPITRYRNRRGLGEFEQHLDVLDRINSTILDRVTIAKLQAFRQRAIKGLPDTYPPGHPKAGERVDYEGVFESDPGAVWMLPVGAEFWESTPIDLSGVRMAVRDDIEHFAALTRTPLHLVVPEATQGSAEGAALQREGLTYKVENRRLRADAGHARTMSIAFALAGKTDRADRTKIQTIWAPSEKYSLQQRASAVAQLVAGEVPAVMAWEEALQWDPGKIARARTLRDQEKLLEPDPIALAAAGRSGGGVAGGAGGNLNSSANPTTPAKTAASNGRGAITPRGGLPR